MWFALALAADVRVPQDASTIGAAVGLASDGDRILIEAGTYAERLQLSARTLELEGLGAVVVQAPSAPHSIASGQIGLRNLELTGPAKTRVLEITDATVVRTGCRVSGGRSALDGGGIGATASTLELVGTDIFDNQANRGGHLAMSGGTLTVEGGLWLQGQASTQGGAMYLGGVGEAGLFGVRFEDNAVDAVGTGSGGALFAGGTLLAVEGGGLQGNTCVGVEGCRGGAVHLLDSNGTLRHVLLEGNDAVDGLALHATDSISTVIGSSFTNQDGTDPEARGTVRFLRGSFALQESRLQGNHANWGGGIALDSATGAIDGSLLCDNDAAPEGCEPSFAGRCRATAAGVAHHPRLPRSPQGLDQLGALDSGGAEKGMRAVASA